MSASEAQVKPDRRRQTMMAVVLSGALTALLPTPALTNQPPEAIARAVNDLSRYCTVCWRNARLHPDSWGDCTQEVFNRLLQRVTPGAWERVLQDNSEERREFIRAIDAVKKRTQRSKKWVPESIDYLADRRDLHQRQIAEQREAVAQAAQEVLSARQQRILQLSLDGWSVQEIATEMSTPPERVSDEKYKAIRKLRNHLGEE